LFLDIEQAKLSPARIHHLLYLTPSHQPLLQNVKYHIRGEGKDLFKINQHNGKATLHIAKKKVIVNHVIVNNQKYSKINAR